MADPTIIKQTPPGTSEKDRFVDVNLATAIVEAGSYTVDISGGEPRVERLHSPDKDSVVYLVPLEGVDEDPPQGKRVTAVQIRYRVQYAVLDNMELDIIHLQDGEPAKVMPFTLDSPFGLSNDTDYLRTAEIDTIYPFPVITQQLLLRLSIDGDNTSIGSNCVWYLLGLRVFYTEVGD